MCFQRFGILFFHCTSQQSRSFLAFISLYIMIIDEIGCSSDIQGSRSRMLNRNIFIRQTDLTAFCYHLTLSFNFDYSFHTFMVSTLAAKNQLFPLLSYRTLQRRIIAYLKIQFTWFIGRETDNDYPIGKRGKNLTLKVHSVYLITGCRHGSFQIKVTIIILSFFMTRRFNNQASDCLIRHTVAPRIKRLVNQILGVHCLSGENQVTYFSQTFERFRIVIPIRSSSPKRFFVQLQFFARCSSINHRSHR